MTTKRGYKDYEVTINDKELCKSEDARHHAAVRDIAALIMLDAAVGECLCRYNDLVEAGQQDAADALYETVKIQITFGSYSASVSLQCMDTYAAFGEFLQEAIYNADAYRS